MDDLNNTNISTYTASYRPLYKIIVYSVDVLAAACVTSDVS